VHAERTSIPARVPAAICEIRRAGPIVGKA
jgi:hypothetical protein